MMVECKCGYASHESASDRTGRRLRLDAILRAGPRALTRADWGAVLPPRNPTGCLQNQERARVARTLMAAGFWDADAQPRAHRRAHT